MRENYYALFLALISPELIRADDAFRSLAHGELYQRKHYKRKQEKEAAADDLRLLRTVRTGSGI